MKKHILFLVFLVILQPIFLYSFNYPQFINESIGTFKTEYLAPLTLTVFTLSALTTYIVTYKTELPQVSSTPQEQHLPA